MAPQDFRGAGTRMHRLGEATAEATAEGEPARTEEGDPDGTGPKIDTISQE